MNSIKHKVMTLAVLSTTALAGCTTAMYSDPSPVTSNKDQYEFFIATGGFSGAETADKRLVQEVNKFMPQHGYHTYKIVKRTDKFIPSGFDYVVQFGK